MRTDKDISPREAAKARFVRRAALAASLPLAAGALWIYAMPPDDAWRADVVRGLTLYGALLLAFLGGIRCGAALGNRGWPGRAEMAWSSVPFAAAAVAAFLPAPASFAALAAGFAGQGAWDALSAHAGAIADWYGPLRTRTTAIAVAALLLAFVATS